MVHFIVCSYHIIYVCSYHVLTFIFLMFYRMWFTMKRVREMIRTILRIFLAISLSSHLIPFSRSHLLSQFWQICIQNPTRLALIIIFAKSKYLMMFSFDVSRQWIAIAEVYEYFNNTAERKIKKYNYNVKGSTEVLYQGWLKHLWGKLYSMRTLTKTFLSLFSLPQSLSKEVNSSEDFWIASTFNQFFRWWLKTR